MPDYAIVFGAGVYPDGTPGPALRHRIDGAIAWARAHPGTMLMPTGGVGRYGPAEALVMRDTFIQAGIDAKRIVPETHGRDTLESVRLCDAILRRRGDAERIVICTNSFHQRRCALLLRLLGYQVAIAPVPGRAASRLRHARAVAKEIVATPYDAALLLAHLIVDRRPRR